MVKDVLTGLGGLPVGGEDLVGTLGDLITGDPAYEIEVSGLEQFNDHAEALSKNINAWKDAFYLTEYAESGLGGGAVEVRGGIFSTAFSITQGVKNGHLFY